MKFTIVIILVVLLVLIYLFQDLWLDNFEQTNYNLKNKYPYNPPTNTPQTNYDEIIKKIKEQQAYKSDLSVALAPTPTINCPELKNKTDCNKYGCNWFGKFCSATYPTEF